MKGKRHKKRGLALILVLGFVVLFSVIAAMMVTSVKKSHRYAKVVADRGSAKYAAESALAYAVWMIAADRRQYPRNRTPGELQTEREALGDLEPPWIADGSTRHLLMGEEHAVEITLLDANRGIDLSGSNPGTRTRTQFSRLTTDDEPLREELDILFDVMDDYVDRDENVRVNGMEKDDYAMGDLEGFPRNRPFAFREEVYWLPNIELLVPKLDTQQKGGVLPEDAVRIIPPVSMRFPAKPAFFSTSADMMRSVTDLSEEEILLAENARRAWYGESVSVRESLAEVYSRVASQMSMTETGIYILEVRAGVPGSEIVRKVTATVDLRSLRPRPTRNREAVPPFTWWQKITY